MAKLALLQQGHPLMPTAKALAPVSVDGTKPLCLPRMRARGRDRPGGGGVRVPGECLVSARPSGRASKRAAVGARE